MKRLFFNLTILGLIAIMFTSCNKDVIDNPNEDNNEYYTVQLGWGGELDITYEPLTKASTDDLYGIQVYSTPDEELGEGETATWTPYAHGVFESGTNISVKLLKDFKYKFAATMVRDGQNLIAKNDAEGTYDAPFDANLKSVSENNTFIYSSEVKMSRIDMGYSNIKSGRFFNRPNTDRYYGELDNYIPREDNNNAKITMKRTSFGAKFIADGKLATSGTLEIKIPDAPKLELSMTEGTDQITDIFTFDNVRNAWLDNSYSETLNVNINWIKTDGTTIPLGSHDITFKRNKTTAVKIQIDNESINGGVGFEIDEIGDIPEDDELGITIKDGEIVDTELSSFDETRYILYKTNRTGGWDDNNENYNSQASYITGGSGKILEMKFKLSSVGSDDIYLASSGNVMKDNSTELTINSTKISMWDGSEEWGNTWNWSDIGVAPTDLIILKLSAIDKTLTINGKQLDCAELENISLSKLFSAYGHESDEGSWTKYYGIPDDSQLYYAKIYDTDGNLTYIGYAAKATNPSTSKEEYCWYSKTGTEETYQFANDAANQGGYGGTF